MNKIYLFAVILSVLPANATVLLDTVTITEPDEMSGLQRISTEVFELGALWDIGTVDSSLFFGQGESLGIGFEYYILDVGDRLNGFIAEGLEPVVTNLGPPRESPFAFDTPQDSQGGALGFYLGFFLQTGEGFENGTFGWVEFENDGTGVLSVASSATAFNEGGIIVGTTTAIPEPSSLILFGTLSLFIFRRKRASGC